MPVTSTKHPTGSLIVSFGSSDHLGEAYLGLVIDENAWREQAHPTLVAQYDAFSRASGVLGHPLPLRVLGVVVFSHLPEEQKTQRYDRDPLRKEIRRHHYRQQDHTRLLWSPERDALELRDLVGIVQIISLMHGRTRYFSDALLDLEIYVRYRSRDRALEDKEATGLYIREMCGCFEKEIPLPVLID